MGREKTTEGWGFHEWGDSGEVDYAMRSGGLVSGSIWFIAFFWLRFDGRWRAWGIGANNLGWRGRESGFS